MSRRNKVKHIKDNRCRVIKLEKDALFEFLYETMIENIEQYFEILDCTKVFSHHKFNPETGEYVCIINDEKVKLPDDLDIDKILLKMPKTTTSMYSGSSRYKEISFEDLREIQNR